MSEQKKIRLSALARTYSIGAHHLTQHLEKKGLGEGVSPNSILTGEQVTTLEQEFGGTQAERVDVREVIRSTVQQGAAVGGSATMAHKEEEPVEELKIKSNTIFAPKSTVITAPKVIGKIDLNAPKSQAVATPVASASSAQGEKIEPPKVEKSEPKAAEPLSAEKSAAQPAVSEAKAEAKTEVKAEAKTGVKAKVEIKVETNVKAAVKTEAKAAVKTEAKAAVKTEAKAEAKTEAKAEVKPESKVGATPAATQETPVAKVEKTGPDIFRANEAAKLTGPKILGKIVLPTPSENRGKRNRIKKNKVDINNATPGNNQQGAQNRPGGANQQGGGANNNNNNNNPNNNNRNNATKGKKGGRPAPRPIVRAQVSDEDVQKQIKETLARLTNKGSKTKSSKYRRDKRDAVHGKMAEEMEKIEQGNSTLQLTEFVTVSELATMMEAPVSEVIAACMNLGLMVSINQRLDAEALSIVAEEFGFKVDFVSVEIQEAIDNEVDKEEDLVSRPPIVTVMGHVDHGKTSLLDYIRKANVIAGEAGGITQHIGAYSVKLDNGKRVTFLDTPGHEAFTAMRARGAKVTDVAIIIVAADDAIMPQTKEAINHAEAAGVPIVFAINKIDKDGSNAEKIKEQLSTMNYLVEDWGGKFQSEDISAKSGLNVDKLIEKIVLEAEILDLKANPNRKASGSVIESTLDKGRGYVTTILVHNGTLRVGDVMLSGTYTGRVKAMFNERGNKVTEAGPATPVLVLGLNGAAQAGDMFNVMNDDKEAREIASKREQLQRMQGLRTQKHITLDEIGRRIAIGSFKELNIIIKGDVDGSIEALTDSLIKLSTEEVQVNVIHKAVGAISESDVLLAAASNAIIVGFQVRPSAAARKMAEKEEIDIRLYSIIYDAINEIKDAIEGMLAPLTKEDVTSSIEVIEVFKISKVGTIAGCIVREGKITRGNNVRIIRDGIVVYTGKLNSLKRFKDEVKEVGTNLECGLAIENYNDIKVGDIVESYVTIEIARKL